MVTFTTTLFQDGNNVGIEVPERVVLGFDAGKRVPVTVTINGYTYASTVAVYGDRYLLPLAKVHREAAGVAGGEIHDVTLEHDAEPRNYPVPHDLADALDLAGVRTAFDALAPSRRKAHITAVEDAKKAETRARRVATVVAGLAGAAE
jgi:hypothetical protein